MSTTLPPIRRAAPPASNAALAVEPPRATDAPRDTVPPLENGDHLSRAEFERRYEAMPDLKKAELIAGVVHVINSPVSFAGHSNPHFALIGWLSAYDLQTPGTQGGDNGTVRLDLENVPQPDVFLRIAPECGGQSGNTSEGDFVTGAPEFVAEIAASSASCDLHEKLRAYCRNGVREYLVWRTWDGAVDWFANDGGRFVPIPAGEDGIVRSTVLPGLWLDPAALVARDRTRVHAVLQQGLATPEHAAFVERLAAARAASGAVPAPTADPARPLRDSSEDAP